MTVGILLLAAHLTFVNPLPGSQAIGPQPIEVTTDVAAIDRVEFYVDGVLAGVARKPPFRIAYDFGDSPASHTVTAKVLSEGYRKTETASVKTAALTAGDSINIDLVEVPLRIRSARALRPEDVRVRENGVEQTVREIRASRPAAHFAFIVDRSLSMDGGRLPAALRAIDDAIGLLREGDTASLILFNHNVNKPRTIGKGISAVSSIVPSGGTSLRDAAASVPAAQRTYAVVLSDGGDRNSQLSDESALRKISGTKSIVSAVVFNDAGTFLERAVSTTGGSLLSANVTTVAAQLRAILVDINSRYVLAYQSRGTQSGWRSISITPARRGVEIVAARNGYFAE